MTKPLPPLRRPSFQSLYCRFPPGPHECSACSRKATACLRDPLVEERLGKHQRRLQFVSLKKDKAGVDTNRKPTTRSGLQKSRFRAGAASGRSPDPFARNIALTSGRETWMLAPHAVVGRKPGPWTDGTRTSIHLTLQSDWFEIVDKIKKAVLYLCIHVYIYIIYIHTHSYRASFPTSQQVQITVKSIRMCILIIYQCKNIMATWQHASINRDQKEKKRKKQEVKKDEN